MSQFSGWNSQVLEDKQRSGKIKLSYTSANILTKQALRILFLKGFYCWRQNNAAVYDAEKKVFRKNSVKKGISDIIGFHRKTGQFIACEIKVGKDKLSREQEAFLELVNESGGIGRVVRNSNDLEQLFKEL